MNSSVVICGWIIEIDSARLKNATNVRNAEESSTGEVILRLRVLSAICVKGAIYSSSSGNFHRITSRE